MVLYSLNFLLSPAIVYFNNDSDLVFYKMKIGKVVYFQLVIPAILLLDLGLNLKKIDIFKPDISVLKIQASMNEWLLKRWFFFGIIMQISSLVINIPSEFKFLIYLISALRYIGAFGLYLVEGRKHFKYIVIVFIIEAFFSIKYGMFHDLLMWLIFWFLLFFYKSKPRNIVKLSIFAFGILFIYVLQISKSDYRAKIWDDNGSKGGVSIFSETIASNTQDNTKISSKAFFLESLTRVNQGWILASTIDNMDAFQNFQGISLSISYLEAAFLPRFLAPNKLKSGEAQIFNQFSGHTISGNTSMGLGMFADGYISFGSIGLLFFALLLGLIFHTIFVIVESWSRIAPFFILFLFPILNYAVRPDCETQTMLGHIVKSIFLYWILTLYYNKYYLKVFNPRSYT